ncbi:hypothetical protein [Glaciecola sp. SC05]|uniref:hypothetical protein n=1 Tax=Glaciecola sp. SC05 TaxID=1987355 RepID=UPI0035289E71
MKSLMMISIGTLLFAITAPSIAQDNILSLSNLERERAALINDMLNPKFDFEERLVRINKRQRQLTDMERMVIRDERLLASEHRTVKQAFDNYELTFLVHAGAEEQKTASSQWLEKVQFSSASVMRASPSYR